MSDNYLKQKKYNCRIGHLLNVIYSNYSLEDTNKSNVSSQCKLRPRLKPMLRITNGKAKDQF